MKALLTDISCPGSTRLFADSAIGRCGNPLFVPEAFAPWHARVAVAVRIGRLGKCIAEKFAMRYVDALTAVSVMQSPSAGNLTYITDSAIIHGDYIHMDEAGETITLSVKVADTAQTLSVPVSDLQIPAVVSTLSVLTTFKTGDLIILSPFSLPVDLELSKNKYISAAINGRQCINFKVK